jgi:hypothetical protein
MICFLSLCCGSNTGSGRVSLRIHITLVRIQISLFTLIADLDLDLAPHQSAANPRLLQLLNFKNDADSILAFYFNGESDPPSQNNAVHADPDQQT